MNLPVGTEAAEQPEPATPRGLSIEGLSAGYGSRVVLEDVSLCAPHGQISVVIGPGGSGKSTLVRALRGISCHSLWWRGAVRAPLEGLAIQQQSPPAAGKILAQLVAPAAPSPALALESSKRLLEAAALNGLPAIAERLRQGLEEPAERVGIGERRLARFVAAAKTAVGCYVFDEPDGELAPELITELVTALLDLRSRAAVLVVTHHLALARSIADRATLIENGSVIESAAGSRFFSRPLHPRTRQFIRLGS